MRYIIYGAVGIGDCIMLLPTLKAIREHDKDAYIRVFARSDKKKVKINREIFSLTNLVDDFEYYCSQEPLHNLKLLLKNGYKTFDYGLVCQYTDTAHTSNKPCKIVTLAAKYTVGGRITKNKSIKYDEYVDPSPGTKMAEMYGRLISKIGIKPSNQFESLLDKDLLQKNCPNVVFTNQGKCIGVVVGTAPVSMKTAEGFLTNAPKNWPYKHWADLVSIIKGKGYNVLLLGGPKEGEDIKNLEEFREGGNLKNFCGKCSIAGSIALLDLCCLVVGADTGLMHCAGALDKPTLTLFGCTDAGEYTPFGRRSYTISSTKECSPCFGTEKAVKCTHKECMEMIKPGQVMAKIEEIIGKEQL